MIIDIKNHHLLQQICFKKKKILSTKSAKLKEVKLNMYCVKTNPFCPQVVNI